MKDPIQELAAGLEAGELQTAEELLPLVYESLREFAAQRLRHDRNGQTLQATALVHEAYLRVLGPRSGDGAIWDGRGHFFAAAAESMRRILVDRARAKGARKRGGDRRRLDLNVSTLCLDEVPAEVLDLHEALERLAEESPEKAQLVELRFFGGLTLAQAARVQGVSLSTAERRWSYARVWLFAAIRGDL